jgi:iron complex transport system permease protein
MTRTRRHPRPPFARHGIAFIAATALLAVLATVAGCLAGSSTVGLGDLWALVTGGPLGTAAQSILLNVRFPRVAAALLAGSALAVAGAVIQAVLDNPMASPNIIGINSGAGLAVLLAGALFPHVLVLPPLAAFCGALISALLVFALSFGTQISRLTVVLAGIAISTVFGAGMNAVLIVEPDAYVNAAGFLVGGLAGVGAQSLAVPAVIIVLGLAVSVVGSGRLNIMSLGDARAHALGMNVKRSRLCYLGLAALLAGAAVSFAGLLGFVGLVVPHLVRFLAGHDNRLVIPASALLGGAFVVLCDLAARVLFSPYELPVGLTMAFLGGPFFIYLIIRNRGFSDAH